MPQITGSLIAPRQSAAPSSPVMGQIYYDIDDNKLYWWNGTSWIESGTASGTPTIYDSDQIGVVKAWSGRTIPTNWVLAVGGTYTKAAYPDGWAFAKAERDAGNLLWNYTANDFTAPNLSHQFIYGATNTAEIGAAGSSGGTAVETLALSQIPAHDHGGLTGTGTTGYVSSDHTHSGSTGGRSAAHNHGPGNSSNFATTNGSTALLGSGGTSRYLVVNYAWTDYETQDHTHGFTTGGISANHQHSVPNLSIPSAGGGGSHNNLPPYVTMGLIVKIGGAAINSGGALVGATGAPGAKGDPGPWRGAWAAATAYAVGDAVSYYDGTVTASYRRKVAGTTAGDPKTDTTNWELIASGGSVGAPGAVTVYESAGDPGVTTVGALWIDTDDAPAAWVTSVPLVTSLPTSPYDGQEIYYLADEPSGTLWHLRYRAASTSAYKWEAIGPTPLWAKADVAITFNSATYIDGSGGPQITPPLNGDYDIEFGSRFGGGPGSSYMYVSPSFAGAVPTDNDGLFLYGTNDDMITSRRVRQNALAGSRIIKLQYKTAAAVNATWDRRHLSVWPIRVG